MVAALKFGKDSQGFNAYAPRPADIKKKVELQNGVSASFDLPEDAAFYTVSFRYQSGTTVWVAFDATAEFPVGPTFSDTDSEMNPATMILAGGTTIDMISPNSLAQVSVVIWQGGN